MERKKPTAKKIREEENILKNPPHREFGGCLPDPPEDCNARRPFIGQDGTEYVDMSLCGHCKTKCARYKQHCKDMDEWLKQVSEIKRQRRIRKGKEQPSKENGNAQ